MMRPCLIAVLFSIALIAPPPTHAAPPDALSIAPEEVVFVAAFSGLDALERRLQGFTEHLASLGFEEPGLEGIRAEIMEEFGLDDDALFKALGLAPGGAIALYVAAPDEAGMVVAIDVGDKRQFEGILTRLVAEESKSFYVPKPEKPKLQRKKRADGATELIFMVGNERVGPMVRYYDNLALLALKVDAFEAAVDLRAGRKPVVFTTLNTGPDSAGFAAHFRPPTQSRDRFLKSLRRNMEELRITAALGDEGPYASAELTITPFALEKLDFVTPNPKSQAVRDAMAKATGAMSPIWTRVSFTPKRLMRSLRTMFGDEVDSAIAEIYEKTKLRIDDDILGVMTGDILTGCNESVADCAIMMGVSSPRKAKKSVDRLLTAISRMQPGLFFETSKSGDRSTQLYTTVVYQQEPDTKGRPKRGATRDDQLRLHWGMSGNMVAFGATPDGVKQALSRRASTPPAMPKRSVALDANRPGFDEETLFATYVRSGEFLGSMHQVLPIIRAALPPNALPGMAMRAVDMLVVIADQTVDAGVSLQRRGLTWSLRASTSMLPKPKGPEQQKLANTLNEAFKHRYAGRLRSAKGSLLELTQRPGQSVWHRKAHALLMDSDSILMQLVNGLVGPGFVGGMGVGIVEAYETLKRRRMSEKTSALECEQLKARRCSGPLKNDDECALAHQGDAALCAAVLQSLDIQ